MRSTYKSDFINNVEEKKKFEERARQTLRPSAPARMAAWKRERETEMDKSWEPMHYNHPFKYESLNIAAWVSDACVWYCAKLFVLLA